MAPRKKKTEEKKQVTDSMNDVLRVQVEQKKHPVVPGPIYVFVGGSINTEKAEGMHAAVLTAAADEVDSIVVRICSPGGSVPDGWAIYDVLRLAPKPVVTEAWGQCHSMAALILQSGDVRCASPNSKIMIHEVHTIIKGAMFQSDEAFRMSEGLDTMNRDYAKILAERSGNSLKQILDWMKAETYFTAEEALKAGLIDEILGS